MISYYLLTVALIVTLIGRRLLAIDNPGGLIGGFFISVAFGIAGHSLLVSLGGVPVHSWISQAFSVLIPWLWWLHGLARMEELITIYRDDNGMPQVDRETVWLRPKGTVTWRVDAGEADQDEVQVVFKPDNDVQGPFPQRPGDPGNPARGTYKRNGPGTLHTTPADPPKFLWKSWKYSIVWAGKRLDPRIMTRR